MRLFSISIAAILALVIFTGCEDEQETNLFKAQKCIDTATQATVSQCSTFIAGDGSTEAYTLQCSIAFIAEGISETSIVNALENIDKSGQSTDPSVTAFSALAMSSTAASTAALNVCTLSGSTALTALANFANLATATGSLASILAIDDDAAREAALQAYLDSYNPATDSSELGAAVIASQDSLCNANNGLLKGTESCTDINAAIATGGGDADAVADALLAGIKDPNP